MGDATRDAPDRGVVVCSACGDPVARAPADASCSGFIWLTNAPPSLGDSDEGLHGCADAARLPVGAAGTTPLTAHDDATPCTADGVVERSNTRFFRRRARTMHSAVAAAAKMQQSTTTPAATYAVIALDTAAPATLPTAPVTFTVELAVDESNTGVADDDPFEVIVEDRDNDVVATRDAVAGCDDGAAAVRVDVADWDCDGDGAAAVRVAVADWDCDDAAAVGVAVADSDDVGEVLLAALWVGLNNSEAELVDENVGNADPLGDCPTLRED